MIQHYMYKTLYNVICRKFKIQPNFKLEFIIVNINLYSFNKHYFNSFKLNICKFLTPFNNIIQN